MCGAFQQLRIDSDTLIEWLKLAHNQVLLRLVVAFIGDVC